MGSASYALYRGDTNFGVTVHLMTADIDGGPILRVDRFQIEDGERCDQLFDRAIARSLEVYRELVRDVARSGPPAPTGEQWARRAVTRREFEGWMVIGPDAPADEVRRKARALRSARFPGPFVEVAGLRFEVPPVRTAAPIARGDKREIAWWQPEMTGSELERIREVIDANYLNDGDVTTRFEQRIAALAGTKHAICVTSGSAALMLGLRAVGVGPGDEVIVPDLTFIASANAVTFAGATAVLADVDPRTLTLDPASVERAITPRTRAIMPVHVSGRGADMPALLALARRHGLAVVEDAAEAFMSKPGGASLGTLGDVGCLSFSPNKTITTGQGGAVLTNDDGFAQRVRELKDQGRPARGTGGNDLHPTLGFNFKLTNLQSAVGLAQLERLGERLERQRRTYRIYATRLGGLEELHLPGFRVDDGETPLWTDALVERRDELDAWLAERGVGCRRFWFPLHTQAPYRQSDDLFPHSTWASPRAIWLPSAFTLSDDEVATVCGLIRDFFASR